MKTFIALCLLALIPVCTSINCYVCTSGSTGCADPFNSAGSGVSQSTTTSGVTNTVCLKAAATNNAVARSGSISCTAIPFVFGIGTACCYTDLCNGAHGNYQTSMILLGVSLALIFAKLRWA